MIGKTLGHYQITEKLGEGGMGVVYKARDTHLDRTVAIKVLPPEKVSDPERKRRFVQEAKSASALNHPNIVHVYDIDQSDGTDYIAMEYVDGKTLDQLIPRKGMRLSEALKCAVQIADALAAAHAAGIIHRDLKPANVMVTDKGLVKVLDFGLAKLTEPVVSDETRTTETLEPHTEEGTIVGTVAYMSPEQAEGKKVDARSDVFSLGSVLYEMATGQKAFQGTSKMSTLAAILHQEPKPVSGATPATPAELERLINRCLRKDLAKRFQHMDDVKVALDELKEDSDSGRLQVTPAAARRASPLRLALVVAAVAVLIAAGWYWLGLRRSAEPEALPTAVPLTSYPGIEDYPSFSPDNTQVAFQWCKDSALPPKNCDIWIKQIGEEPPFQLTSDPAEDFSPAWSPDGRFIAFLRQLSPNKSAVVVVPRTGGTERVLGESGVTLLSIMEGPFLAWTPDSKRLVFTSADSTTPGSGLFLLSIDTLEKRRLTSPPADSDRDLFPAISPDGRTLVFTRDEGLRGDLYLLHLGANYEPKGAPERLPSMEEQWTCSPTWMPDGSEIVFVSGGYASRGLWRMAASASAKPRRLAIEAKSIEAVAISRGGSRLAYVLPEYSINIWGVDLRGPSRTPSAPFKLIPSTRGELHPDYSPDGKRIVFSSGRSGHFEIWVCNSDGSNSVRLTSFGGPNVTVPRWSPDGRSIVFTVEVRKGEIYVISASGGPPQCLKTGGGNWPSWSRDSQSVYFDSAGEVWKIPAAGGEPVQVTRNGGGLPRESPDGKFLYYMKEWPSPCSIWRMPVEGGAETKVLDSVHSFGHWTVAEQGIYFFGPEDQKGRSNINFYDFAAGKTRKILTIEKPISEHIEISPDARTILYTQIDEAGSDLMLVENFR
jgi:serine/threonine protein kinase